jgi:hypothetical protein
MLKMTKFMLFSLFLLSLFSFFGYKVIRKYYTSGPDDADMMTSRPASSALAMIIDQVFGGPKEEEIITDSSDAEILAGATFEDNFSSKGILDEAGSMNESSNKNWWLNSGGQFIYNNGIGQTVQGNLSSLNPWRIAYKLDNPEDTDNGYHPQNIFRFVTRSKWNNFVQQVYFKINKDNLSSSSNRNESNGVLLFNRYQNGQTLYYTGVRVDGAAVIKKKYNGTYYTMAYKSIIPGKYNRSSKPDLLPKDTWFGIKSEVSTNSNGEVVIKLYTDVGKTGKWTLVLETKDVKKKYGKDVISKEGYAGIRTDFMDVDFSGFKITQL